MAGKRFAQLGLIVSFVAAVGCSLQGWFFPSLVAWVVFTGVLLALGSGVLESGEDGERGDR